MSNNWKEKEIIENIERLITKLQNFSTNNRHDPIYRYRCDARGISSSIKKAVLGL